MYQEGRTVFKYAITNMSNAVEIVAKRNNLTKDDIAWIIPHQANVRIETAVARRIGVPEEKVLINIDHFANTSGGLSHFVFGNMNLNSKEGKTSFLLHLELHSPWGASYMKWAYDGTKFHK